MNTVGLDLRMVQHTGIGTYLRGLLQGFSEIETPSELNFKFYGAGESLHAIRAASVSEPFEAPIYSLQEQWLYPKLTQGCDLWHAPHYNIPYFKKGKLVVTVHDLIHWIYRRDFFSPLQALYAETMFRQVADKADHIIAVSAHTAKDLEQHFQANPSKISVIYESVSSQYRRQEESSALLPFRRKYGLPEHFFLYVGSLKPHKNVQALLRAARQLKGKLRSEIVVVGRKDKKYNSEFKELENLQTGGGIHYFPQIDYSELQLFYSAARALVHLSLYEGFGLTPLEAMACGTPVLASNRSSIPEVTGDAALLVDPLHEAQIAQALLQMDQDDELCAELRMKGYDRLKKFSWKETARQTLEVYKKVLAS